MPTADCRPPTAGRESHFSGPWMSALDNRRSIKELAMEYTPLDTYLARLVAYHCAQPPCTPVGYETRAAKRTLAGEVAEACPTLRINSNE